MALKDMTVLASMILCLSASCTDNKLVIGPEPKEDTGGLLYFASYNYRTRTDVVDHPNLAGALFSFSWNEIESNKGVYDWSALESDIQPWIAAGKHVALRIGWSSNGAWADPGANRPTPSWVWAAGARFAYSAGTDTEVPLQWDPVYQTHADKFLTAVADKWDGHPRILFIDVTPGGETNPYRGSIDNTDPAFAQTFTSTATSDGRTYSHELWAQTVRTMIDKAAARFTETPLLVTLNQGTVNGPSYFYEFGSWAVNRGCLVGQNGLAEGSMPEGSSRLSFFREWGTRTRFYFEMVGSSVSGRAGDIMGVMEAAARADAYYLGVYPEDVLRSMPAQNFDQRWADAFTYGASAVGER